MDTVAEATAVELTVASPVLVAAELPDAVELSDAAELLDPDDAPLDADAAEVTDPAPDAEEALPDDAVDAEAVNPRLEYRTKPSALKQLVDVPFPTAR